MLPKGRHITPKWAWLCYAVYRDAARAGSSATAELIVVLPCHISLHCARFMICVLYSTCILILYFTLIECECHIEI